VKAEQINLQKAEAKRAHDEAAQIKKATTERIRQEAAQARQAALAARRGIPKKVVPKPAEETGWDWLWPGDPVPPSPDTAKVKGAKKGPYTGTK
jgi:hypothetical protein